MEEDKEEEEVEAADRGVIFKKKLINSSDFNIMYCKGCGGGGGAGGGGTFFKIFYNF